MYRVIWRFFVDGIRMTGIRASYRHAFVTRHHSLGSRKDERWTIEPNLVALGGLRSVVHPWSTVQRGFYREAKLI